MKPDADYPNIPTLKQARCDVAATPQIRAVVAPRAFPKDALTYCKDLFSRLRQSASWMKYVEDNQLEDSCANDAELAKSIEQLEKEVRVQFQLAGMKLVRSRQSS